MATRDEVIRLRLALDDRDLERQTVQATKRANDRARQQSRTSREPASDDATAGAGSSSRSRRRLSDEERHARELDRLRKQQLRAYDGLLNAAMRLGSFTRMLHSPLGALLDVHRIVNNLRSVRQQQQLPGQQVQGLANVSRLSQTYQQVYRAARMVPPPPPEIAPTQQRDRPMRPSSPTEAVAERSAERTEVLKGMKDVLGGSNKGIVAEMKARGETSLRNILGPLYPTDEERQVGTSQNRPKEPGAARPKMNLPRVRSIAKYLQESRGTGFGNAASSLLGEGAGAAEGAEGAVAAGAAAEGVGAAAAGGAAGGAVAGAAGAGALAALAGPVGIAAAGLLVVGFAAKKFGDMMESITERYGRYHAGTAVAMAQYKARTVQNDISRAQSFGGAMTGWVHLKTSFSDLGTALINKLKGVFDFLGKGMDKLANWIERLAKLLGYKADQNNFIKGFINPFGDARLAPTRNRTETAAIGGIKTGVFGLGSAADMEREASGLEERADAEEGNLRVADLTPEQRAASRRHISEMRARARRLRTSLPVRRYMPLKRLEDQIRTSLLTASKAQDAAGRVDELKVARDLETKANQLRRQQGLPEQNYEQGYDFNAPAAIPPRVNLNANPPPLLNAMIPFQQTVQMTLQTKIMHEKHILDSIAAVRDKLYRDWGTARDEARLALAMLNFGPGVM